MARTLEEVARERGLGLEELLFGAGSAAPVVSVEGRPAPKAKVLTSLPPEVRLADPRPGVAVRTHVILVGAGGVGARLAPLLVKHLIAHDALTIVDHDIVELKNITRQHFTSADVGKPKALVVAQRAQAAAPSPGVIVTGVQQKVEAPLALSALCPYVDNVAAPWRMEPRVNNQPVVYNTVLVTAIDSRAGRRAVADAWYQLPAYESVKAWIDCGNDMLSGQAMVVGLNGMLQVRTPGQSTVTPWVNFAGWEVLAPQFLEKPDEEDAAENCAVRLDTQSVLANTWAATVAATLTVPFITGASIGSLGVSFSIRTGGTRTVGIERVEEDGDGGWKLRVPALLA